MRIRRQILVALPTLGSLLLLSGCGDDDGNVDALGDAGVDAGICVNAHHRYNEFVATNKVCSSDDDCIIVGGCSNTLGFAAVAASVRRQAQELSNAPSSCGKFDGPLYDAVCLEKKCTLMRNGRACGMKPVDASARSGQSDQ